MAQENDLRKTVKVFPDLRDFLKEVTNSTKFPIKSITQLLTLTSLKWHNDYQNADPDQKKKMIEEMKQLQLVAEQKNFLVHSREIRDDVIE